MINEILGTLWEIVLSQIVAIIVFSFTAVATVIALRTHIYLSFAKWRFKRKIKNNRKYGRHIYSHKCKQSIRHYTPIEIRSFKTKEKVKHGR